MQDGTISDGQISASSARRKDYGPANARLQFSGTDVRVGAWVAGKKDPNEWLQVDFGNETRVTAIETQGRTRHLCGWCKNWVKKYTVSYSLDNATFHPYEQKGRVKVQCWEIVIVSVLSVLWVSWLVNICFLLLFSQFKGIPGQLGPRLYRSSCVEFPRCGALHPHQSYRVEWTHRHEGGVPGIQNRFGLHSLPFL